MKDSVRMWTASGTLVTIIAIAIGLLSIYFQTDPGENHTLVLDVLLVLQITGADLFALAILEWKQEVSSITVLILMAIGDLNGVQIANGCLSMTKKAAYFYQIQP